MSEPKISRRCPACGASIRELAFFCPQCGRAMEDSGGDPAVAPATKPLNEPPSLRTANLNDTLVERGPVTSSDQTRRLDDNSRNPDKRDRTKNQAARDEPSIQEAVAKAEDGQRRKAPRDASESNVLQRVEKLRKVSSVVIDEATYDPSLRFILVAAVLFILFLVIVILNKVIG